MAAVYACDAGCGFTSEDPTDLVARGVLQVRSYCPECVGEVDDYIDERDRLHDECAERWREGLALIVERHALANGALPDVG